MHFCVPESSPLPARPIVVMECSSKAVRWQQKQFAGSLCRLQLYARRVIARIVLLFCTIARERQSMAAPAFLRAHRQSTSGYLVHFYACTPPYARTLTNECVAHAKGVILNSAGCATRSTYLAKLNRYVRNSNNADISVRLLGRPD